jgi:hypothetical protein
MRVCIVGGGNAAQAMAALFPHSGITCNMYVPYQDEAFRLRKAIDEQGYIAAHFAEHNRFAGEVRGKPAIISNLASEVIPDCDVLIMPLPSFAYRDVLTEIKPYLKVGALIGATPGQGGFDWIAKEVLGDRADDVVLFSILPMPFNCRIVEFGKKVYVQEFKKKYKVGSTPTSAISKAVEATKMLFGHAESCGHFLSCSLYPINAVIHPARLYALCNNWNEGDFFPENPLFYEAMDDVSTALMDNVNKELIEVAEVLNTAGVDTIEVPHIKNFLADYVYQDKSPTLTDFFKSNLAYKGFRCPFIEKDGGWVPDFTNRYFTEDIPLGLCLYKGVADIVEIETPTMDKILRWAQTHMAKEYLLGDRLIGKDIHETTCPQRFGITTIKELIG